MTDLWPALLPELAGAPSGADLFRNEGFGWDLANADRIQSAFIESLSASKITSGTITAETIVLDGASGVLQSSNYVAGTSGWRILGDGSAEFNNVTVRGTIHATAGTIGGLTITNDITLAGGVLYNKASNPRVRLDSNGFSVLNGAGTAVGSLTFDTTLGAAYFSAALGVGGVLTAGAWSAVGVEGVKFASSTGGDFVGSVWANAENAGVRNGGQLRMAVGSTPSKLAQYGFHDSAAANNAGLGYDTAGDVVLLVQSNTTRATVGATGIRTSAGSASTPGFAFLTQTGMGFFIVDTEAMGFATGGAERIRMLEPSGQTHAQVRTHYGTAGFPNFNPGGLNGDIDSGYYGVSDGITAISGNGTICAVFDVPNTDIRPGVDNTFNLGNASFRFVDVWAVDTTINSSDLRRKVKSSLRSLRVDPVQLVRDIPVVEFRRHRRKRTHTGWLAQDVKAALMAHGVDYAALIDPEAVGEEGEMGLRIGELTAILWAACQQYDRRLAALEKG